MAGPQHPVGAPAVGKHPPCTLQFPCQARMGVQLPVENALDEDCATVCGPQPKAVRHTANGYRNLRWGVRAEVFDVYPAPMIPKVLGDKAPMAVVRLVLTAE